MATTTDRTPQGTFAPGNRAAQTHGLRSGLGQSRLPKDCQTIHRHAARFRRTLAEAVRSKAGRANGALTVAEEGLIVSAVTHEQRRRLAQRWLRIEWEANRLTTEGFLKLQEVMGSATRQRDEAVASLLGNGHSLPPTGEDGQPGLSAETFAKLRQAMGYGGGSPEDLASK